MLNSTILLYKRRKKLKFEAEIGEKLSREKTQKKWYGCLLVLFFWRRIYTQQSSPYFQFFKKWYAVKIWGGQVQKKVFFNNLKAKDTTRFHCLVGSPPNHFLDRTFLSKWLKLVFTQRSIVKKRRHYTQHSFYMIWLLWISSNHRSLFLNWTLNAAGLVGSAGVTLLLLLSLLSEHGGFGRARQSFPVAFAATGSSHSKPFQGLVKTGPTFDGMLLLLLTLVTHHLCHGWGRWSSAEFLG